MEWILFFAVATFLAATVIIVSLIVLGLRTVQEQERLVIERFGKYNRTLRSGLNLIIPWIEKVRAAVPVWELIIQLFEEPIKIDFKDGSAVPKGAEVFVRIKSPDDPYSVTGEGSATGVERAIYHIEDWQIAIRDEIENAVRSYLNGLFIDDAITQARAGYDLKNQLPKSERGRLSKVLSGWGFDFLRVTIQDFDLDQRLVDARAEVQIKQREAEAAAYTRRARAQEAMGALIQMIAESTGENPDAVQARIAADKDLQVEMRRIAEEFVSRKMSIDGNALTDIRSGGGDLEQFLMRLIAALKGS